MCKNFTVTKKQAHSTISVDSMKSDELVKGEPLSKGILGSECLRKGHLEKLPGKSHVSPGSPDFAKEGIKAYKKKIISNLCLYVSQKLNHMLKYSCTNKHYLSTKP